MTGELAGPEADAYFYRAGKKILLRRVPVQEARPERAAVGEPEAYVQAGGDPERVLIPTGQVVVQFAPEVDSERVERELAGRGGRIVRPLAYLANGYLVDARASPGGPLGLANDLHEQPFVQAAEPNWLRRLRRRS